IQQGQLSAAEVDEWLDAHIASIPMPTSWQAKAYREKAGAAIARFQRWAASRDAEVLGTEVAFEFTRELSGVRLRINGAIDRLERVESGLQVVDFKTARVVPTNRAVRGLEQLGVYQTAIESGSFAAGDRSAGAEAVYLGNEYASGQPVTRRQDALSTHPHLGDDPQEADYPNWVEHRLAKAARIVAAGEYPAIGNEHCQGCSFNAGCPVKGA
ncbi:MAG: PD-(D/E)XK nuclease family protein, partial [Propionibacteriaceae bacterium]|nr:PD-(D/E)XK nuclease family protein [Propionibacteriaceae bacterium]